MTAVLDHLKDELTHELLAQLRASGGKVAGLALIEAERLAEAIARVGAALASGQLDANEAVVLMKVQKDASEAVLCALVEITRREAAGAVAATLARAIGMVDSALATVLRQAAAAI